MTNLSQYKLGETTVALGESATEAKTLDYEFEVTGGAKPFDLTFGFQKKNSGNTPAEIIVDDVVLTYKPTVMLANAADNTATLTANNGKLSHVRLADRTFFKDDSWNTLCLPFSMTAEQVAAQLAPAALMELDVEGSYNGHKTGLDGDKLYLYFKDATAITAGTPYLVKWNANSGDDIVSPVFRSVTLSAGEASSTTTIMMTTLSRQKLSLIQPFQLSIQL